MSDYIGGLMRASGLAASGMAGESGLARMSVARPTFAVEALEENRPALQPAPAGARPSAAVPPRPEPKPQPQPVGTAGETANGHPSARPVGQDPVRLPLERQPRETMRPAPARPRPEAGLPVRKALHPLARAALDWVARAPGHPVQAHPVPQQAAPVAASSSPVAPPPATVRAATPAQAAGIEARSTSIPSPALSSIAPAVRATMARDERIEVSIGAIHLRVEPPAPRTVAAAPPQPPANAAGAGAQSNPHGALARRSLRRI